MRFERSIINKIIDKNFVWADLNSKYSNTEQLKTNVFCPFHQHNYTEGNAKFYYDDEKELWLLHCFVERRNFYAHDYLQKIMCEQKQFYKSPLDFLVEKLGKSELVRQYKLFEKEDISLIESQIDKKCDWIDNLYNETGNVVDYVEELYTA